MMSLATNKARMMSKSAQCPTSADRTTASSTIQEIGAQKYEKTSAAGVLIVRRFVVAVLRQAGCAYRCVKPSPVSGATGWFMNALLSWTHPLPRRSPPAGILDREDGLDRYPYAEVLLLLHVEARLL